ncbi:MAG: riboflavin biosynthesis protein RibF [Bacilli bacterium]|nr:riboflavin biosynthesis protein RibF [Bacilli bacterium]
MEILEFTYPNTPKIQDDIVLCLGYFDGIHLGHKQLILDAAKEGYKVGVLTFDNPPAVVLGKIKQNRSLSSIADKVEYLEDLGVEYLFLMHFDEETAKLSKDEFIQSVIKPINPKKIFCGEDYKFGLWGEGTPDYLSKFFNVFIHSFVCSGGNKISTRDICTLIEEGKIEKANGMLGRPYRINGLVVEGLHNGAKFDFPTANLKLDYPYTFPKDGVYYGIADVYGVRYKAIISVGSHPTIMPLKKSIIEVHIIDYSGNLYGKDIFVEFLYYARDILHFASVQELTDQLKKDKNKANKVVEL